AVDDYHVRPEAGPWMICTASYTGPEAAQLANKLVTEIRRDYKLPAYYFNRGAEERQKQKEEIDRIRKLSPEGRIRIIRIEDQFAVLVGGYKDMETARKELDRIKKLPPPKSVPQDSVGISVPQKGVDRAFLNPFQHSFVVRNPSVPAPKEDRNK